MRTLTHAKHLRCCGFPSPSCSGAYIWACRPCGLVDSAASPQDCMYFSTSRTVLHSASHGDVPVRRSGEEGGTHGTHGTVADGTTGHKRQRDTLAVLHMLRISVPSSCLGKNLRSKVFHCAKLRDGTRDSVLALKYMQSFTCFADALAFRGRSLVLRKAQRIS